MARCHPDIIFFVSNAIDSISYQHGMSLLKEGCNRQYNPGNNIYVCRDILKLLDTDIIETAYFSHFCDLIVGRSSGVYSLSIERHNTIEKPKKFLCFSHMERDKDLGVTSMLPHLASNFLWSCNYNYSNMLEMIEKGLR
jgi:hypothetical protein